MDLHDRVAIVTGASSGIGAAIAVELADQGATVIGVARRQAELEVTVERCRQRSPKSVAITADLAERPECERLVADVLGRFGRVDVLVNNAGISKRKPAAETSPDEIELVMAINFFAAVHLTMGVLPGMLERRSGSIVNVTSVAGYLPNPLESAYGASKAALSLWTHGLAVDLHDTGVHLGVLSPGPIDTEIWAKDEVPAAYEGKLYPPETVAKGVVTMIEKRKVHMTVPRTYGLPGALYPLLQRPMRWGLRTFEERAEKKQAAR